MMTLDPVDVVEGWIVSHDGVFWQYQRSSEI